MTAVRHYAVRPATQHAWTPPRLSRAELEALIRNRPGIGVNAAHVVDDIVAAHAALDGLDARRLPDGTLSERDQRDFDARSAPLQGWFQALGLYPVREAS